MHIKNRDKKGDKTPFIALYRNLRILNHVPTFLLVKRVFYVIAEFNSGGQKIEICPLIYKILCSFRYNVKNKGTK